MTVGLCFCTIALDGFEMDLLYSLHPKPPFNNSSNHTENSSHHPTKKICLSIFPNIEHPRFFPTVV